MAQVDRLLDLLDSNLAARVTTFGSRNEYLTTRYVPRGTLRTFLDEVLPIWRTTDTGSHEAGVLYTEHDASRSLSMLQTALVVDQILQAYGIGSREVLSAETFTASPVIVKMQQNLWYSDFHDEQLVQMKQAKVLVDIIMQRCPNFYALYDEKKVEYDKLVYVLDRHKLDSWSDSCQCRVGDFAGR
jgi:hypothetical protein